jgi:endo-1,4-beta-xylanase
MEHEPQYVEVLTREFNTVVAENIFKPHYIWKSPDSFDFTATDKLAEFAAKHNMTLRGHTLVWHAAVPTWLKDGDYSADNIRELLHKYINAVVTKYKGVIPVWDVVNEAISDGENADWRENSFWYEKLGDGFIADAFTWAHEADPACKLYYNDYESEDLRSKGNRVYKLAQDLLASGVPIHGVGLQGHLVDGFRANDDHRAQVRRIAALGLDWQYTEVDIRLKLDGNPATPEQLELQAQGYADLINICMKEPRCTGFLTWGFTDKYSWIPGFRPGEGASLPFDEHYQPKPAYHAISKELAA